jgi:hypothetical protein
MNSVCRRRNPGVALVDHAAVAVYSGPPATSIDSLMQWVRQFEVSKPVTCAFSTTLLIMAGAGCAKVWDLSGFALCLCSRILCSATARSAMCSSHAKHSE